MWVVRSKDERVAHAHVGCSVSVAHTTLTADHKIEFPLRRVRMIREIEFPRWDAGPLQIKRMTFGQIERRPIAPDRFRDSLEGSGEFAARRLPRLFLDLFDVYFAHSSPLSFRAKSRNPVE